MKTFAVKNQGFSPTI